MGELTWADVRESGFRLDDVEAALGLSVDRRGDEDWALCPLPTHTGDRSDAHFSINNQSYQWKCFTCGGGGGMVALVEQCLSVDRQAAVEWLGQFSDADSASATVEHKLKKYLGYVHRERDWGYERSPTLPWLPPHMIEEYKFDYWRDADIQAWVYERWGVKHKTAKTFGLGLALGYTHKRRLKGDALIIPHFWKGSLVGWQARWINVDEVEILFGTGKAPKYVNTDDFPKEFTVYNWDRAVKHAADPLIVVESFATVMKLHQCGYPASVATFGASISDHQRKVLGSWRGPVMLAGDNDAAGRASIAANVEKLRQAVPVWIIPTPEGEKADLGDQNPAEIDRLISLAYRP